MQKVLSFQCALRFPPEGGIAGDCKRDPGSCGFVVSGLVRALTAGIDLGAYPFATPALRIVNTTMGPSTWPVWDCCTVTITGAVPQAQFAVAVASWSPPPLGYAGNFTISGYAYPVVDRRRCAAEPQSAGDHGRSMKMHT